MFRIALALFAVAVGVLLPSAAWARPFAGVARAVCEPLAIASEAGASEAAPGEELCCTSPDCEAAAEPIDLDLSVGWAPLCDPSGASEATRIVLYDPRPASIVAVPCESPDAFEGALIGGDENPNTVSPGPALGWAILSDNPAPLAPRAAPVAQAPRLTGGPRIGFRSGVYRPPLA